MLLINIKENESLETYLCTSFNSLYQQFPHFLGEEEYFGLGWLFKTVKCLFDSRQEVKKYYQESKLILTDNSD